MHAFRFIFGLLLMLWLAGCASSQQSAQISEQSDSTGRTLQTKQDQTVYEVLRGDTLTKIGVRFGVTSLQLQYRNNITDPRRLRIGLRLIIPDKNQQVPPSFASKARFIWPLKKLDVSSEFGTRNNRHNGIDLRAPQGTAIRASAKGVVQFVGLQRGYGYVVILKHAGGVQTFYAHNDKNLVKKGQQVAQGEMIATVGISGNATGYHVHFEFIKGHQALNPRLYVSNKKG